MPATPAASLSGVAKSFGAVRALLPTTLNIARGQCLGIVGHNGAGKSTLMNALAGVLQPDAGSVSIGGRPVSGPGAPRAASAIRAAHALGLRCVFQELSLCGASVPGVWGAALFMFLLVAMLNASGAGPGLRLLLTGIIIIGVITLARGERAR